MSAARGPSGAAPAPPSSLASTPLPVDLIAALTPLHRVHRAENDPLFFGPGPGIAPTNRFDSATGAFGVLYVGLGFAAALVETLLRNPRRRMVAYAEIETRSSSVIVCERPLNVVRLHGDGLQRLGLDNSISSGPYEPCGAWADALWRHPEAPDGVAYRSRHDPDQICLALFERRLPLRAGPPVRLIDQLAEAARILSAYGKSVAVGGN